MAQRSDPTAIAEWLPRLNDVVATAASTAGLSQPRAPEAAFNGDEWVWEWRHYLDDAVVSDVRLRVSVDESSEIMHTAVSGLAWPLDPRLRYLARSAVRSHEGATLEMFLASKRRSLTVFQTRLADRLARALAAADEAAIAVLLQLGRRRGADRRHPDAAIEAVGRVDDETNPLKERIEELESRLQTLTAEMQTLKSHPLGADRNGESTHIVSTSILSADAVSEIARSEGTPAKVRCSRRFQLVGPGPVVDLVECGGQLRVHARDGFGRALSISRLLTILTQHTPNWTPTIGTMLFDLPLDDLESIPPDLLPISSAADDDSQAIRSDRLTIASAGHAVSVRIPGKP